MISIHFQGKLFNIAVIQIYVPTTNAKEAEVEWFCEDLQHLLELTPKKVLFISDWKAKVGSQVLVCMLSGFHCVLLSATLWTMTCQAPLSMGFSRQEYWSGLPFPSPRKSRDTWKNRQVWPWSTK